MLVTVKTAKMTCPVIASENSFEQYMFDTKYTYLKLGQEHTYLLWVISTVFVSLKMTKGIQLDNSFSSKRG